MPKEEVRGPDARTTRARSISAGPWNRLCLSWLRGPGLQVRIGLVMDSGRFGITTRWQHLKCTIFTGISTVDEIEGFEYLEGRSARTFISLP